MKKKTDSSGGMAAAIARTIRLVPRGKVSTYGAIARAAGFPRCSRHVAKVLNQVPGLPWQRILGAGGRISLRGEYAFEQRFLLEAEGVQFRGKKADMARFEHHFGRVKAPPRALRAPKTGRARVPQK
jgi:methylated-DNA-protein-cysteine methyltransferase-like protein